MNTPPATLGLRHLALCVQELEACERFYVDRLGMRVEWRPDADNLYLTSGVDNLALHRQTRGQPREPQRLDHLGFFLATPEAVDDWYLYLQKHGVRMRNPPRDHRDGARSFYCYDPDGTLVQFIHHPPLAGVALHPPRT